MPSPSSGSYCTIYILSDRKGDKGRGAISGSVDKQLRYIDCSGERGGGRLDASLFMMLLLGRGGD